MKLLNRSILFISVSLLFIVGFWSVVFYYNITSEIKESVDEGLDNYKRQIIFQAHQDTALLKQVDFDEGFYAISEITKEEALRKKDEYSDTLIYIPKRQGDLKKEPFRLLSTAFEDDGRYYSLEVINSMVEKDDLIEQVFKNMTLLYILLILSILVINNWVLRKIWHPFYNFLNQLRNYKIGSKKSFPKVDTKTKEFADLQMAVHQLLRYNLNNLNQQKRFISNASHELQTPLAIILNKLELLLEKDHLSSEDAVYIVETIQIIERLIRLNKSLLFLSKIENRQFPGNEKISINQIVRQGIQEMEDIVHFKGLRISARDLKELEVNMDPALAEALIFNLLRNAVFHTEAGGDIILSVDSRKLEVINTGKKGLKTPDLFKRFQKSEGSSGGFGLGLSIVKAICDFYGFEISYSFRNSGHYFIVIFKKSRKK